MKLKSADLLQNLQGADWFGASIDLPEKVSIPVRVKSLAGRGTDTWYAGFIFKNLLRVPVGTTMG